MKITPKAIAALFTCAFAFGAYGALEENAESVTVDVVPTASAVENTVAFETLATVKTIASFDTVAVFASTCAVIRPLASHSDCNYSLCEDQGCGAPTHFDPIDCACYCGYAF